MGVILHAVDRFTKRQVAYKRLLVRDERSRARMTALLQREYQTLSRLVHPNIVEVYDYGVDAEGPYYVMELLSGDDLAKLAPLPFREACRLLRDVASALALIHARQLIHRDVSPGNVRVTSDGRAKLIDFGALMPFGKAKELVGTPAFMAPECLADAPLDQRSDLFSLGAVAYWLLTHRSAVQARSIEDLEEAWATPLLAPSIYVPELPRELDELVLSLLARDPLARPASAADVIERLSSIAGLAPEADERRVAYSYLAHPALVGRKEVRAALVSTVDHAFEEHGGAVLIEASAGLGRSALLDDVALYAQLAGATVLRAAGEPGTSSFALARKLVKDLYALYPDLEDQVATRESFHSYHPSEAKLVRARSPMEIAERHAEVITVVQETLLAGAKRGPLLVVVDDLHAVDHESLALLASLSQSVAEQPIAIVASAATDHSEQRTLAYTNFASNATRFALGPLNDDELVELVTYVFGSVPNGVRLAQWLKAQSGGNPSTAMDLTRLLLQRDSIRYTGGTFTLPVDAGQDLSQDDLARKNLARLGDLSQMARRIAIFLSIHEGALSHAQLSHALGASEGEVALALEELAARNVTVHSELGVTLSSASLAAALERATGDERRSLHELIARALLADGDTDVETSLSASSHLLQAGLPDEAAQIVHTKTRFDLDGPVAARFASTLESVLTVYRQRGRSKEACLSLMLPLTRAGFYGDPRVATRHYETTLAWMSLVCGMTLARALRPYLGGKLALLCGLVYAAVRRGRVPKSERLGTVKEMLASFLGSAASCVASAASSLDGKTALGVVALLEPFAVMKPETSAGLLYEFIVATAELSAGSFESAIARYTRLIPLVAKPLPGVDAGLSEGIYRGSLNGCAQAAATAGSPKTLALADLLEGNPFFAPHAECARMTHYGYRGERDKAEQHRARAELCALRGGTSWSAMTVLAVRAMYIAVFNRDALGLLQALHELERFAPIAPKLRTVKTVGEACLEHLRGKPERAVALFEGVLFTEDARQLASWMVDRVLYATALNAAQQYARAREVCSELLGPPPHEGAVRGRMVMPQLALAEAGLGQHQLAADMMDGLIAELEPQGGPLELGGAHRDRALIATMAANKPAYERHFAEMKRLFGATQNSSLITQLDLVEGAAQRAGISSTVARVVHARAFDEFDSTTVIEQQETHERVRGAS